MYCTRTVLTLYLWSETRRRCVVTTLVFPSGIGNGSLFSSLLFCGYVGGWRGVVLLGSKTRVRGGDDRTPKRLGFMYTPLPLLRNSEGRLTLLRRDGRTEGERGIKGDRRRRRRSLSLFSYQVRPSVPPVPSPPPLIPHRHVKGGKLIKPKGPEETSSAAYCMKT